jgi:hypothetical protein
MRSFILPILVCSCFALAPHAQDVKVWETNIVLQRLHHQRRSGPAKRAVEKIGDQLPLGLAGPPLPVHHFHTARWSLLNTGVLRLEIGVARDKIVFNMGEITGNIWLAQLKAW